MTLLRLWSRKRHDITVFICLLAVLLYVPVPLGSNRPYAWLCLEMLAFGLLAFWAVGVALVNEPRRLPDPVVRIVTVLILWLGLIFLQTLELPDAIVQVLNPFAFSFQENLRLLSVEPVNTLSIDAGNSFNELLKYAAYVTIFFLLVSTITSKVRLLWGVALVVTAGVLEAAFGIYCYITDFVIFPETHAGNELRAGTFVNRNHFSNLLTMVLGLVVGLLTAVINSIPGTRSVLDRYSDKDMAIVLLLLATALVMLAAVFTSGSRAPLIFFTISFAVMLIVAYSGEQAKKGEFLIVPLILVGAVTTVLVIGFDQSVMRLVDKNLLAGERMLQNFLGLELLSVVWLTGVGAGNYRWAFTMYRDDDLRFVVYDHAHNDYLQTAIEQGLVGFVLMGLAVILIIRELYKGYRGRRNPLIRGVIFGCMLSLIYMLLHSAVEFNFRIPANAVYFFALAALGVSACRVDRQRRRPRSIKSRRREFSDG